MTRLAEAQRLLRKRVPGPQSVALHERKLASVADSVGTALPVYVERAESGLLIDVDGNELIDFGSGIAVTNVGAADPRVVEAVQRQVQNFTHTCFMVTPYEGYVAVCERLAELTPGTHEKRSALFNSGAEAVENAIKIARRATRRQAVVAFDHAYHGRTNLTMALTSKNMPYKHGFGPFAGEIFRAPMAYPYRWNGDRQRVAEEAYAAFEAQVHAQVGEDNVAAVIVEPIQGEGGFIVPPRGWLPRLQRWCQDHGALLIADEIQTGFCRTGDWFACDHEQVVPDLIATAKGIAGGLPLGAVTGRAEVMNSVHAGGLGGTYGGNPVACAAALAAMETMEELELDSRAREIGDVFVQRLGRLQDNVDAIGEVRGRGAMIAIELIAGVGDTTPAPELAAAINKRCHEHGLVTLTAGTYGNVLRFLPPLTIPEALLQQGLDILEDAVLTAVYGGLQ